MPVRPPALSDVSFEVGAGQTLLIVGPSGSGKSTLALAIAGLVPRDFDGAFEGSLEVDGTETRTWDPAALSARVGIVFQDPESQLVMERVEDDVAFGLENRGWLRGRMLARVPEALREVDLDGFERRRTSRLSGGEQQRVALGGVLAALPGILVLDEPTANLDPGGTADFFARLAAIKSQGDTSIVLVEHRVDLPGRSRTSSWRSTARAGRSTSGVPTRSSCAPVCACGARGSGCPNGPCGLVPWACRANPTGPTLIEAHGLRFGYDHTDPILRDIDPSPGGPSGSRSSAPTAAASRRSGACSSASCGPTTGRCCSAPTTRRAFGRPSWRGGRDTSSRTPKPSS